MTLIQRFLALILVGAFPLSCLAEPKNDFPSLEALLPHQTVQVDIMEVRTPARAQEISARFQKAMGANQQWFAQYMKDNANHKPLPYHKNFGISAEEYAYFLNLPKVSTLEKRASLTMNVTQTKTGIAIRFDDTQNLLQPIAIDLIQQTVETPLAKMASPEKWESGPEKGGLLGQHQSYNWTAREGSAESGSSLSIEFTLGRVLATGREFIQYRVLKLVNQKTAVRFETLLEFDLPK